MIPRENIPPPWRHQKQATDWMLARDSSYMDMDMGTGKSRAFIDFTDQIDAELILVSTTKRGTVHVWPGQFEDWCRREVEVVALGGKASVAKRTERAEKIMRMAGHSKLKEITLAERRPVVVICNWEMYRSKAFEAWLKEWNWSAMAGDEMHRIKSHNGSTSKAVARVWQRSAARKVALSGTPMPHDPLDVWAQYRALDPSTLGTRFALFKSRYAIMGGYVNPRTGRPCNVVAWQNLDDLKSRLAPTMFQPLPEDVELDLPSTRHLQVVVDLAPQGAKLYATVEADIAAQVQRGEINPQNGLVKLLRLQQLASGIAASEEIDDYGGTERHVEIVDTAKRDALAEILDGTSERVVVFCVFRHELDMIHEAARGLGPQGAVASAEISGRADDLDAWKSDAPGTPRVLAVQIAAGSEALDFTQSRHCVFMSTGFNMGLYLQALKRCHRPGQKHPVTYYHLLARNTVDHRCYSTLLKRGDLVRDALSGLRDLCPV